MSNGEPSDIINFLKQMGPYYTDKRLARFIRKIYGVYYTPNRISLIRHKNNIYKIYFARKYNRRRYHLKISNEIILSISKKIIEENDGKEITFVKTKYFPQPAVAGKVLAILAKHGIAAKWSNLRKGSAWKVDMPKLKAFVKKLENGAEKDIC